MFSSEEQHPPEYHELKKRQSFIWVFLSLVVLMIGGILAFVVYGIMSGGGSIAPTPAPVTVTPAPAKSNGAAVAEKKSVGTYFLTGELFPNDKKFRISKVFYPKFSKEEFFAVPWVNAKITPAVARYGDYLGVFSQPGTGIFIGKDGKVASVNDAAFFPPYVYFSVSPDEKKMVYFRYLSSVGTTSLTIRDMEKNEDLFGWPVGSSASEPCEFKGWSADGAKAYCLSVRRGAVTLKTIDVNKYVVATAVSAAGAQTGEYYADLDVLITAERDGIVIREIAAGKRVVIIDSSEAKAASHVALAPDGKTIAFTAHDAVYSVDVLSGVQKNVAKGDLVGITPDSQSVLFREQIDEFMKGDHYSMTAFDGTNHRNLHTVMSAVSLSQFLGWFSE